MLTPADSVRLPGFKERGRGGIIQPGHSGSTHDYALSSSRRGLRGLWQLLQPFAVLSRDRSCFSLFQGSESRRSQEKPVSA